MDRCYTRARMLLEAEVDDELVALDERQGLCFGFNNVATSVWKLIEQPRSLAYIESALRQEYEVPADQCVAEVRQLLDDLVERGLARAI
jgi:hypothetical protein